MSSTEREGSELKGWQGKVAQGTSGVGLIAAPAALGSAIAGRKEGGLPRKAMYRATGGKGKAPNKFGRSRLGGLIRRAATK